MTSYIAFNKVKLELLRYVIVSHLINLDGWGL